MKLSSSSKQPEMVATFSLSYYSVMLSFWGISEQGEIVSLIVIDGGYIEPTYDSLTFNWDLSKAGQPIDLPEFKMMGIEVKIHTVPRSSNVLRITFSGPRQPFYLQAEEIEFLVNKKFQHSESLTSIGRTWPSHKPIHFEPQKGISYEIKMRMATGYRSVFK